jgi:hypothetical protein
MVLPLLRSHHRDWYAECGISGSICIKDFHSGGWATGHANIRSDCSLHWATGHANIRSDCSLQRNRSCTKGWTITLVLGKGKFHMITSFCITGSSLAWVFKGVLNRAIQSKTSRLGSGGACISGRIPGALVIAMLEHLVTVHRMGTADSSSPLSEELCEDTASPIAEAIGACATTSQQPGAAHM